MAQDSACRMELTLRHLPTSALLFDKALAKAGLPKAVASYLLLQQPGGLSREGRLQWGISARSDLLVYL